jgi:copper resistance protein D
MTDIRTTPAPRLNLVLALVTFALVGVMIGLAITARAPVPGVPEPSAVVRVGIPVARVLLDLAAVITLGMCVLPMLIGFDRPKRAEPALAGARRVAMASSLTWAITALAALVLQTAELRPDTNVSFGAIVTYVRTVGAGKALLFVTAFAMISTALAAWSVRAGESVPAELRAAVALFALLPLPVTGHAVDSQSIDLTMLSLELHVASATAWTGGLSAVVVVLAANRTLLARALPRFSTLATICLITVGVTGLVNGFAELLSKVNMANAMFGNGSLTRELFHTDYGLIMIGKAICYVAVAVIGAHIRWKLLPGVARQQRTALLGWAALELGVLGVAFGLAVVLARSTAA